MGSSSDGSSSNKGSSGSSSGGGTDEDSSQEDGNEEGVDGEDRFSEGGEGTQKQADSHEYGYGSGFEGKYPRAPGREEQKTEDVGNEQETVEAEKGDILRDWTTEGSESAERSWENVTRFQDGKDVHMGKFNMEVAKEGNLRRELALILNKKKQELQEEDVRLEEAEETLDKAFMGMEIDETAVADEDERLTYPPKEIDVSVHAGVARQIVQEGSGEKLSEKSKKKGRKKSSKPLFNLGRKSGSKR
jgi:hypothetical protein